VDGPRSNPETIMDPFHGSSPTINSPISGPASISPGGKSSSILTGIENRES